MSSHNSYTSESSANASIKNTVSTDNQAAGNKPTVNELAQSLNKIVSEGRNPDTLDIDTLSTEGILARINNEDAKVANAVTSQIPQIGKAVDAATISIRNGGRLANKQILVDCMHVWQKLLHFWKVRKHSDKLCRRDKR